MPEAFEAGRQAERERAEQRGAERVFAALSAYFAAHPDFERVLADFTARGLTKEGAASEVVPEVMEGLSGHETPENKLVITAHKSSGEGAVGRKAAGDFGRGAASTPAVAITPSPVDPDRELVEEVARALSVARCGLPDGAYSEADARVVIPLVEQAVLARVVAAIEAEMRAIERLDSYPVTGELWGKHAGLKAAAVLASSERGAGG